MLEFCQSCMDFELKLMGEEFEYNIKSVDGKRLETSDLVKIESYKSLIDRENISFLFSSSYLCELKIFLLNIKKELSLKNIDFSALLNLHNEKVQINKEINDDRSFGFLRVILMDKNNNVHMDDISISENYQLDLKEKIRSYVDKNAQKIMASFGAKRKNLFEKINIVFSPQAAGYFVHEILGHTLESDFYSYYKDKYKDLKICNKLKVTDSPIGYKNTLGIGEFDDNGEKIKPLTLVENSKITNIFSDNINDSFDSKIYGVSRRESYRMHTLPRMRATFIEPSDDLNEADIIRKYDYGVFMDKAHMGGVDPSTGIYNLTGNGFIIENGDKKNFIGNLKISGNIFKDLGNIGFIGNDFEVFLSFCAKMGQSVRVGIGAPTISVVSMTAEGEIYE